MVAVQVHAPATIGNFGPGIDAFSLALHGHGDTIHLEEADEDTVTVTGPSADRIPGKWTDNAAGVTLDALRLAGFVDARFRVRIEKGQPAGSGLGSSASSAGGAALAFHALYPDAGLTANDLVKAAAEGEAAAAGYHFDDVSAVVMGGLAIVQLRNGEPSVTRVQPPGDLWLAVARPDLDLPTREMRRLLPAAVPFPDAVHNVANAARMVDGFHRGDIPAIGAALEDRMSLPYRKVRLPFYDAVAEAGRGAGAHGIALSGSGPTMVGVCGSDEEAQAVAAAMGEALEAAGQDHTCFVAQPEREVMHLAVRMHHV